MAEEKKKKSKKETESTEKSLINSEKSKKLTSEEYEKRVLELSKEGLTSEKIGEKLRREGIHPKEHGRKISEILKKNNRYENPDLKNIETKLGKIRNHMEKNKQDKKAMREMDRIASQLRKQKTYFGLAK